MRCLAVATNLTYFQVLNFATNLRKRHMKATIENNKKPMHFLDFLFLANHRYKFHEDDDSNLRKRRRSIDDGDSGRGKQKMMKLKHQGSNRVVSFSLTHSGNVIQHLNSVEKPDDERVGGYPLRGLSGRKRFYEEINDDNDEVSSTQKDYHFQKKQKVVQAQDDSSVELVKCCPNRPSTPPNKFSSNEHDSRAVIEISPIRSGNKSVSSTLISDTKKHSAFSLNSKQVSNMTEKHVIEEYTKGGILKTPPASDDEGDDDDDDISLDKLFPGAHAKDFFSKDWVAFADKNFAAAGAVDAVASDASALDISSFNMNCKAPKKKSGLLLHVRQNSDISEITTKLPFDQAGFDIDNFFR